MVQQRPVLLDESLGGASAGNGRSPQPDLLKQRKEQISIANART